MKQQIAVIFVKRETLHQQVWSVPRRTLAERYDVSERMLADACRRHRIPCPTHEQQVEMARRWCLDRPPLPPLEGQQLGEISLYPASGGGWNFRDPMSVAATAGSPPPSIVVPARLTSPHRLVESTHDLLAEVGGFSDGSSQQEILDIQVSRQNLLRALRIMDTLIKAWISIGGTVVTERRRRGSSDWLTKFAIAEDEVPVRIEERRCSDAGSRRRFKGHLILRTQLSVLRLRHTWSDGAGQRLEDVLESVVSGLLRHIVGWKQIEEYSVIKSRQARRLRDRREATVKEREESVNLPLSEIELTCIARPILEAFGIQDTDELYGFTEDALGSSLLWSEVCRVLETLGYDTSHRSYDAKIAGCGSSPT